ncbi:MAG TPA: hypothetical protein VFM70_02510 [Salinimicrobium sp.]|nr:hypothetical protein [Salinimicrobium sp.]
MLEYKTKNTFPLAVRVFGFLFIGCGLIILLDGSLIGFSPIVLGAIFGFTFEGIQIDLENGRFKEFTGFLKFKKGKWRSNKNYPFVSLLEFNVQSVIYSLSNSKSVSSKVVYRLYMLNSSHFEKILIKEFNVENKAKEFADQFVETTNLQLVTYSPTISTASRNRRR